MIGILSTAENRFCGGCLETLPLDQFRRRKRGDTTRHNRCNKCHRQCQREWYARRQAAKRDSTVAKGMTKIRNCASVEELQFVFREMFVPLGGVEGFIEAYRNWSAKALSHTRGSAQGGSIFSALLRMLELLRPKPIDMENLTQPDLERAMVQMMSNGIRGNPELVTGILQEAGYTVIPPE